MTDHYFYIRTKTENAKAWSIIVRMKPDDPENALGFLAKHDGRTPVRPRIWHGTEIETVLTKLRSKRYRVPRLFEAVERT